MEPKVEIGFAFHASSDGRAWRLVRYFALEPAGEMEVGFLAQSPAGAGCTAGFDQIAYLPERLADLRGGGWPGARPAGPVLRAGRAPLRR